MPDISLYGAAFDSLMQFAATIAIVSIVFLAFTIACKWKIFQKAGKDGWKALIPIYSDYVLYDIAWDGKIYFAQLAFTICMFLIPANSGIAALATLFSLATLILSIMLLIKLSDAFGLGGGFAVGLILLQPIFLAILAFGSSQYVGKATKTTDVK